MRSAAWWWGLALVSWAAACGGGGDGPTPPDVRAWVNLEVGLVEHFDVDVGVTVLDGRREVEALDTEYRGGTGAYRVVLRQNNIPVATRWYQVGEAGLFLLGEEVKEGVSLVARSFVTPVKILPYPLESAAGVPVQTWTTVSEIEEGGSETHRYDNAGKAALSVPAGSFEAWRLVHTRTDSQSQSHGYDEWFVPEQGFVKFEYPDGEVWSLRP